MIKPRMAVAYHYWNHRDIELEIYDRVRQTYGGPISLKQVQPLLRRPVYRRSY